MNQQQLPLGQETKFKKSLFNLREKRRMQVATYMLVILVGGILARQWYYSTFLMLIYFFGWLGKTKDDFSRLELGDRMYFMGYTFTLISLGYVLYDPTKYAGTLEAFYYFGTAVFTSIVGLIIRSGLHLFHRNPEQQMDEINAKIGVVGEKVVADLDKFSETLNARISALEQELTRSQEKHQAILEDNLKLYSDSATEATQAFGKNISKVLERSIQSLDHYQTDLLNELSEKREALKNQFKELTGLLIKETEQTKGESKTILQEFSNNHAELSETLSKLSKLQKDSIAGLDKNLEMIAGKTSAAIEKATGTLETFVQSLNSQTEEAIKNSSKTYGALNDSFSNTLKLIQQLDEQVSGLKQRLSGDEIFKPISNSVAVLQDSIREVSSTSLRLLELLKSLRNNTNEVKELNNLTDEIRQTIKRKLDEGFNRK